MRPVSASPEVKTSPGRLRLAPPFSLLRSFPPSVTLPVPRGPRSSGAETTQPDASRTPWLLSGRWSWASPRRHRPGGCAASSSRAKWAGGPRGSVWRGCRGPGRWRARAAAARSPSCCRCTRRCPAGTTPSTAASFSSAVGSRRAAPACEVSGTPGSRAEVKSRSGMSRVIETVS